MMKISVCVGSSCHLKGSPAVIELLKQAVEKNGLQDKVALRAAFCLGKCGGNGVSIQVDDTVIPGVNPANFPDFFETNVLNQFK